MLQAAVAARWGCVWWVVIAGVRCVCVCVCVCVVEAVAEVVVRSEAGVVQPARQAAVKLARVREAGYFETHNARPQSPTTTHIPT